MTKKFFLFFFIFETSSDCDVAIVGQLTNCQNFSNGFKIDTGRAEYVKSDSRGYETISDNVHIHFISVQNYSENLIRHSGSFFFLPWICWV